MAKGTIAVHFIELFTNLNRKGKVMKKVMYCLVALCMMQVFAGKGYAETKGPVEIVADGCKKEINMYCKDVTPGEGRVLACLYAHEDKLSSRCEYALYDAAAQLERAVTALTYLANECREDLKAYCSDIKPGEGRLIQCIDRNKKKISGRCKQAIKDVGQK
jgi:hypothetical protein